MSKRSRSKKQSRSWPRFCPAQLLPVGSQEVAKLPCRESSASASARLADTGTARGRASEAAERLTLFCENCDSPFLTGYFGISTSTAAGATSTGNHTVPPVLVRISKECFPGGSEAAVVTAFAGSAFRSRTTGV